MKLCTKCSATIPAGRLKVLPHAETCVTCSSTEKVHGLTIVVGEGDHTYNDLVIVNDEQYKQLTSKQLLDGNNDLELLSDDDGLVTTKVTPSRMKINDVIEDIIPEELHVVDLSKTEEKEYDYEEDDDEGIKDEDEVESTSTTEQPKKRGRKPKQK